MAVFVNEFLNLIPALRNLYLFSSVIEIQKSGNVDKKDQEREKRRNILSFSFIRFQIHVTICTCDVIMVTYAEAERQNYKDWKSVRFMNKTFKAN